MRKKLNERIEVIDAHPVAVKAAIMEAKTDRELVDVIGAIKSAERRYRGDVQGAVAEVKPEANHVLKGDVYAVETKNEAKRSYNTPNLMTKFQAEGVTLFDLLDAGVLTLSWRWTDLKRFAASRGIDLDIVEREVPTMDSKEEADVGELWNTGSPRWT